MNNVSMMSTSTSPEASLDSNFPSADVVAGEVKPAAFNTNKRIALENETPTRKEKLAVSSKVSQLDTSLLVCLFSLYSLALVVGSTISTTFVGIALAAIITLLALASVIPHPNFIFAKKAKSQDVEIQTTKSISKPDKEINLE